MEALKLSTMPENTERFCPEGIPTNIISNDVGISFLDASVICTILERVAAGEDASSFGDEAKALLGNIGLQLANKVEDEDWLVL